MLDDFRLAHEAWEHYEQGEGRPRADGPPSSKPHARQELRVRAGDCGGTVAKELLAGASSRRPVDGRKNSSGDGPPTCIHIC